jgi:hypothetical protein
MEMNHLACCNRAGRVERQTMCGDRTTRAISPSANNKSNAALNTPHLHAIANQCQK